MPMLSDDMISQVRSQVDESNTDNITNAQILANLNIAQRHAANIISRKYEELLWDNTTVSTTSGTREYDIPVESYGSRITKIEVLSNNGVSRFKLDKLDNHKTTPFLSTGTTNIPRFYSLKRNKFEIYPTPSGGLTLYVHYYKRPYDLVLNQGRIASINTGSNYITVDSLGSSLTTVTSGFGAYVNVIDFNTGNIKRSLQISAINTSTKQITFKSSSLTRSTVLNRTISTSIGTEVAVDDYICIVNGSCISELDDSYTDYIMQHAALALKRRLGDPSAEDFSELQRMEEELNRSWAAREAAFRVNKVSKNWTR